MRTSCYLFFIVTFTSLSCFSQSLQFNRYDSLRGSLSSVRKGFDVYYYDFFLEIDINRKSIAGSNTIHFKALHNLERLQIDLYNNMAIDSILLQGQTLSFTRDSNSIFIKLGHTVKKGESALVKIIYHGKPHQAFNPPWDGGFVWTKDSIGHDWVGVSCEGIGASLWWPNKDHLSDEPDSMRMQFKVPASFYCVSNGILRSVRKSGDDRVFEWFVNYPINNYNVTLNIAQYAHIHDKLVYTNGDTLALDYYILPYHQPKARKHFQQAGIIIQEYEKLFGPYPFLKDGYALVETPYWGMEHQGAISYGNKFENDVLDYDFIILHETAHEWWGNSLSVNDHGEMWIHEAFATYSESLFIENKYGKETALKYLLMQKARIKNRQPILGPLEVNYDGWDDADMYYKGAWMLHTLRSMIVNDSLWFSLLKNLHKEYFHKHIDTEILIDYFEKKTGRTLKWFFKEYLTTKDVPEFAYSLTKVGKKYVLQFQWRGVDNDFKMPVTISFDKQVKALQPGTGPKKIELTLRNPSTFTVNTDNFYINTIRLNW